MEISRKSFSFFRSYYEAARDLSKKERAEFYEAIIEYSFTGKEPEVKGVVSICWKLVKPTLEKSMQDVLNGAKGGRPKKKENPGFSEKETPGFENSKSQSITGEGEGEGEGEGCFALSPELADHVIPAGAPPKNGHLSVQIRSGINHENPRLREKSGIFVCKGVVQRPFAPPLRWSRRSAESRSPSPSSPPNRRRTACAGARPRVRGRGCAARRRWPGPPLARR